MVYKLSDFKQSAIGSFSAVIIFLALRGNSPFYFDYKKGIIITAILFWIYYNGYRMKDKLEHFVINLIITFTISTFLSHTFGLITFEKIFSIEVFGSLVIIAVWVGFLHALLYDRHNFTNPMEHEYVRGK